MNERFIGVTGGREQLSTPALLLDLELRYTLERGGHGIYTYAIFTHEPTYGPTQIVESRYGMKLSGDLFDWLSVDAQRNGKMAAGTDWDKGTAVNMNEARRLTTGLKAGQVEHKYDYSAGMFDTPAYGWSSTKRRRQWRRSIAAYLLARRALRRQRDVDCRQ